MRNGTLIRAKSLTAIISNQALQSRALTSSLTQATQLGLRLQLHASNIKHPSPL